MPKYEYVVDTFKNGYHTVLVEKQYSSTESRLVNLDVSVLDYGDRFTLACGSLGDTLEQLDSIINYLQTVRQDLQLEIDKPLKEECPF